MPTKKPVLRTPAVAKKEKVENELPSAQSVIPEPIRDFLAHPAARAAVNVGKPLVSLGEVKKRLLQMNIKPTVSLDRFARCLNYIDPRTPEPEPKRAEEVRASIRALKPQARRFHGAKLSLYWFPFPRLASACADRFGYMSPTAVRTASALPFNLGMQTLLGKLGDMMGDPGRETGPDSTIPAGYTYFGQFVDHDITFDVSSSLDAFTDANTLNNMRSPHLDLDSVYSRGPGLDPFMYVFPTASPSTAIKFQMGTNTNVGPGGPSNTGAPGGMATQTNFDVPRTPGSLTAIIGDPRNDENLIIVQFQHAMLRFHNAVVDLLVAAGFSGDIFAEAKRIVTHHYQWAVMHDFLKRICGAPAVTAAMGSVLAPVGSAFRMPVEFAVAAYRFGHSMIRDNYWVNFNFTNATLGQVFEFSRVPRLPVFSNWVVDFNAFFDTGIVVPVNNKARKIDSVLAAGLEALPGFPPGLMQILATRNLRRGLALGLPSGQAMANHFGIAPMTTAQMTSGLPAAEVTVLNLSSQILLKKTPLWYYVLREAAVLGGGDQLGPVGARIVAETFVRILKRDASSFLNAPGGFTPFLPSTVAGDFTVADLITFSGVHQP